MNVKLQNSLENSLEIYTWKAKKRFRLRSLLWFMLVVVELLLVTHLLLELFASDSTGNLKNIIDSIAEYLLMPLFVVFGISPSSDPIFEWAVTLFAIIFYCFLVMGMLPFFRTRNNVSQIEIARAHSKRKYGY